MRSCSACRAVSTVIYISAERPCRYIGARRYAICRRNVHSTQPLLRLDGSPKIPEAVYSQQVDRISEPSEIRSTASPANGSSGGAGDPPDGSGKPVARSNYGSALRRAARNLKKFPEIPRFELPQSFLQHNVVLWEDAPSETHSVTGTVVPVDTAFDPKVVASNENLENSPSAAQIAERKDSSNNHSGRADRPVWRVDGRVIEEIESVMRANLQVPARQGIKPTIAARPHLVLHCPRKGGIASMDAVIRHLATSNKADLIKLDAQDLAGLGGNYLDGPGDPKPESLSTLGYDVHAPVEAHDHTVTMESFSTPERISIAAGDVAVIPLSTEIVQTIANMLKGRHSPPKSQQPLASAASKDMGLTTAESTRELKLAFFLDALLGACDTKRAVKGAEAETPDTESPTNGSDDVKDLDQVTTAKSSSDAPSKASRPVILQIDDYPEISHTDNGNWLLSAIHDALYQRRIEGQRIILIGTCSAENPELAPARLNHQILPHDFASAPTRTIVTPAVVEREPKATFLRYHRLRNMVINAKNLRDMTRRLAGTPDLIDNLPSDTIRGTYMPEEVILKMQRHVWSSGYAHRVSMVALGINQRNNEALTTKHIEEAISMVEGTDKAKHSWTNGDKGRNRVSDGNGPGSKANKWRSGSKKERAQLEKECNEHEKKLLNGMINPADIRTTFDNVHVSKETVQTLKDLTLLPLACPQEFEYGVLAEQNISGLLLYGPPGTGKTLLAKAVAKDGGATILEVSGADLYNKWVGESEKLVKALFSLARKLKPCIVFLDEADAILGSRDRDRNRNSHRDLINQFLREWDGMKEVSALIMVATNRPFDLDDAVVRRLPRRILVDLPTEKDREEILKIHLSKEILDPEVSLAKLAADTPLYSGSDLKHLVVTAAQACVRENYDTAMSHSKSPPSGSQPVPSSPALSSPQASVPQSLGPTLSPPPTSVSSVLSPALSAPSFSPGSPQPPSSSMLPPLLNESSMAANSISSSGQDLLNAPNPELNHQHHTLKNMPKNAVVELDGQSFDCAHVMAQALPDAPFGSGLCRIRTLCWLESLAPELKGRLLAPLKAALSSQQSLHTFFWMKRPRGIRIDNPSFPNLPPKSDVDGSSSTTTTRSSTTSAQSSPPPPPLAATSAASESANNNTRRILRPHHFARALEEISASVSEDMGSLTAIKKFDEKYGDRRGRKKKLGGAFGFSTLEEGERERLRGQSARVRV